MRTPCIALFCFFIAACKAEPIAPEGTPLCDETCEAAWPCGAVLQNDLASCKANCSDESLNHANYRVCIAESSCDTMPDCKVYAPEP